jgi:hypothetical protein
MKTHSPNVTRGAHSTEVVLIARDATSTLKDLGQKHLEAPCVIPKAFLKCDVKTNSTIWLEDYLACRDGRADDDFSSSRSSSST